MTSPAEQALADRTRYSFARSLITERVNVSPKRLVAPGPNEEQLHEMLTMAVAAPDHGQITPWRFVLVPAEKRGLLAEAFALALIDRDPGATLKQIEMAREKAYRAPTLMLAIAKVGEHDSQIPVEERLIALGAAIQNILLTATAMGFGSGLTSGQAMTSPRIRVLFGLEAGEMAACFANIGSTSHAKVARLRPPVESILSHL